MDTQETRTKVVGLLAAVMCDGSLLAPHVATEIAERQVEVLVTGEYLITEGKIMSATSSSLEDINDEGNKYEVYTPSEPNEEN